MKGSEVGYSTNNDKEEIPAQNGTGSQGKESSNASVVENSQVKETTMKMKEKGEKEKDDGEENQTESKKPCVNGDKLNNEVVTDIEHEMEDQIGTNNKDEDRDNRDSMEMNPHGWDKDYEIRINLLKQEINETEKKHEVWQNEIKIHKEEAIKRWEMIKKKHQDHLKAHRRIYAVMDSVLNKDNEEIKKEEDKCRDI